MRFLIAAALATGCTSFEIDDEREIVSVTRQLDIAIPDDNDSGVNDIAQIERACTVDAVEVDIEIRHEFRGDVFASLTSPAGTLLILKTTLDNDDGVDVVGTYPTTLPPLQPLDRYGGEEGMGGWLLNVGDLGTDDTGTLVAWTLRLACL